MSKWPIIPALLVAAAMPTASGQLSLSIGADWDADQIVPWQQGVSEATLLVGRSGSGGAIDSRHLLLGSFEGPVWKERVIRKLTHDQPVPGQDRYRLEFDPVVDCSVMLVVAAGPTTGLGEPVALVFGQLTGDVNGDLQVTPVDALLVNNHIVYTRPYDPQLDVDRNGSVAASDYLIIINRINHNPEGVPFAETDPVRPPPGDAVMIRLMPNLPRDEVVLSLTNLAFAREYRIEVSSDCAGWELHDTHVGCSRIPATPVLIPASFAPAGCGYFRVVWGSRVLVR